MTKPVVPFIAMPLYNAFGSHYLAQHALWRGATTRQLNLLSSPSTNSVLPHCFNDLLCAAMNFRESHGVTHFAMLHGDIVPQVGWFDVLYDELCATKADVVSVVVPIKNSEGFTSTAIGKRLPNGRPTQFKLTMRDVFELPETFGIYDTPWNDGENSLLFNSGVMAFKLDSWVDQFLADGGFGFETWCEKNDDGTWRSCALSEDWRFALWCGEHGIKSVVTRKVECKHYGFSAYTNDIPWGTAPMNEQLKPEAIGA